MVIRKEEDKGLSKEEKDELEKIRKTDRERLIDDLKRWQLDVNKQNTIKRYSEYD